MAYTKTPEQDTHNKYRIRPVGNQSLTTNTLDWSSYAGSKFVNCYPTIRESKSADPRICLMKAPDLRTVTWTFPDTDVGITQFDFDTGIFIWKDKIYQATAPGPTISLLETDPAGGTFLTVQKVIDYALDGDIIVAGLYAEPVTNDIYAYRYNYTTDTLDIGPDVLCNGSSLYYTSGYSDEIYVIGTEEVASPRDLIIDGYHIVALKTQGTGTNRVLVSKVATGNKGSNVGDYIEFDTTVDYFTPEIDPDNLVDIQKHHNYICVIGTKTIEFFYDAAVETGSPFVRQENYTILLGASQNVSANMGAVTINNGDDIYFFANALFGGNGIYMIRDFKAVKISDDYIDMLLNNTQGVTSQVNTAQAKLGLANIYGNIHVGVELLNTTTGEYTTYIFNETDKVWWEYVKSNDDGLVFTDTGYVTNFSGQPIMIRGEVLGIASGAQHSVSSVTTNEAGSTITLEFVSKDPDRSCRTAMYITQMQDLDTNNWKHLKGVDMIGEYGNNIIQMSWTKYSDWSNWSQYQSKTPASLGQDQAIRYYNLGQARRFAFRFLFRGTDQIVHDAVEVSYNIRTQ